LYLLAHVQGRIADQRAPPSLVAVTAMGYDALAYAVVALAGAVVR
jgi:hypothetical protein